MGTVGGNNVVRKSQVVKQVPQNFVQRAGESQERDTIQTNFNMGSELGKSIDKSEIISRKVNEDGFQNPMFNNNQYSNDIGQSMNVTEKNNISAVRNNNNTSMGFGDETKLEY